MFNKYHALALASLLGFGVLAMPGGTASAAALPYVQQNLPGETVTNENLLQQVHRRRRGHRNFNHFGLYFSPFAFGSGYGYGYGYHPYRYSYPSRYYGGSSAHVRWCHNRYRSYNSWNNSWISYSGHVRQCRSPYRYY